MSSASSSNASKGRSFRLDYEPSLYCYCGLKAPLCVGRESGRMFYGCQNWKVRACGYFLWKDGLQTPVAVNAEKRNEITDEAKAMISRLADQLSAMQGQIEGLRRVIESEAKDRDGLRRVLESEAKEAKLFRMLFGFAVIAVLAFAALAYVNAITT
ncbi:unnamed protein product [Cuscuta epithymum]|uniref:Zinc finger GRF-type domain-containing protein n=1 Tax=Cuscuta epithymum TaxID=186058 RepID=A0AAV0CZR2_9ASTE|nr:unnamed protein product [Cuscuta epithymum]